MEGLPNNLKVEETDLKSQWIEAYLYLDEICSYLRLQTGIPEPIIRAHVIAAAGYCKWPPKWKDAAFILSGEMYCVNSAHIRAMRRAIFDFVPKEEVYVIVEAFRADEFGEPGSISFNQLDEDVHFSVVRAVLEELNSRGQLPLHPSHEFGA